MTRARCAECGAVLAVDSFLESLGCLYVHPCGACLQEAAADALDGYMDSLAEAKQLIDEGRD